MGASRSQAGAVRRGIYTITSLRAESDRVVARSRYVCTGALRTLVPLASCEQGVTRAATVPHVAPTDRSRRVGPEKLSARDPSFQEGRDLYCALVHDP
jgi:hypothetical protein